VQKLHFPQPDLRIQLVNEAPQVWDVVRKKWVALTPEEWVRQHLIHFLNDNRRWPFSLMAVEKSITFNSMVRRADVVLYNRAMKPVLIAECKAPEVPIVQATLDQAAVYNRVLGVDFLLLTNGLHTSCCQFTDAAAGYEWLSDVPFGE
jgi:type I site-specific restriction endonuclease